MSDLDPTKLIWKKSTVSNPSGNCAEVSTSGGMVLVRDSKNRAPFAFLSFYGDEWDAFIAGVKAGEFDFTDRCLTRKPPGNYPPAEQQPTLKTMEQVIEGLKRSRE